MNYYEFVANDQMWNNWLLFTEDERRPSLQLKARYKRFFCPRCDKFDHDSIFKEGFDPDIRIRGRGDIIATDDGFHCFNERVKRVLEREDYLGLMMKPLGDSEWYVANVTLRVRADAAAYQLHKPFCRQCKRAAEVTGILDYLSEIEVPKRTKTFFSTLMDRQCSAYLDRPVFVTEDIVDGLKNGGIQGGMFRKLLDAEEETQLKASIAKGKARWPAQSKLFL